MGTFPALDAENTIQRTEAVTAPLTMVVRSNQRVSAAKTDYTARARTDIPGGLAAQAPSASAEVTVAALMD